MNPYETSITLFPYELTLQQGEKKPGVLLLVETETGQKGWGDIAPLKGWSGESYTEALEAAKALRDQIYRKDLTPIELPPSVHFGYEMAMHQIQHPLEQDLTDIRITTLLQGTPDEILAKPTQKDIKLKVGNHTLEQACQLVSTYRNTHTLRVDFNGQWPLEQVLTFCQRFDAKDFLYLEDPVANPQLLPSFIETTGYPTALDALALRMPSAAIRNLPGTAHVIIKPSLIGVYSRCQQWIRDLHPIPCHFSSTFESRVGHLHILRMAKELTRDASLGIGTYAYIEQDILPQKLDLMRPTLPKNLYNHMLYDPSEVLSHS